MCSWDNSKLKTNSQLPSEPRNQRHCLGFVFEDQKKKGGWGGHFWLLIVEECLSKLWSYQAQNVAREGGTCAREREEGQRDFAGDREGVGSENGKRDLPAQDTVVTPLCAALWLSRLPSTPASPGNLSALAD